MLGRLNVQSNLDCQRSQGGGEELLVTWLVLFCYGHLYTTCMFTQGMHACCSPLTHACQVLCIQSNH